MPVAAVFVDVWLACHMHGRGHISRIPDDGTGRAICCGFWQPLLQFHVQIQDHPLHLHWGAGVGLVRRLSDRPRPDWLSNMQGRLCGCADSRLENDPENTVGTDVLVVEETQSAALNPTNSSHSVPRKLSELQGRARAKIIGSRGSSFALGKPVR